jgi:hypothetical protein
VLKSVRALLCAAILSVGIRASIAQEQQAPQQKTARPQDTFFSGNVTSVTADKVTVSRRTLTLTLVTRVFLLDSATQIDGTLKPKARVTV